MTWNAQWETRIVDWLSEQLANADSGHGLDHVRRVVVSARQITVLEQAQLEVVLPAAWLHDCVLVAKDSPLRHQASSLAAQRAAEFLKSIDYPIELIDPIVHCIEAHSFSAAIPCRTLEAQVVQDADRLDALGAIGIARCLMTGGAMQQRLYHPDSPFPHDRLPDERQQSVDHFFTKLLTLADKMKTDTGRKLARQRTDFLVSFLHQLSEEIGAENSSLSLALQQLHLPPVRDPAASDKP